MSYSFVTGKATAEHAERAESLLLSILRRFPCAVSRSSLTAGSLPRIPHSTFHILDSSASADEVHDLDLVTLVHRGATEGVAFEHGQVVLDGDAACVDLQLLQKVGHGEWTGEVARLAVQSNPQGRESF